MGSNEKDASYRDWCKKDGVSTLQSTAVFPPRSSYHASSSSQPIHFTHRKPASTTPAATEPVSYSRHTDHMCTFYPAPHVKPLERDPKKFDTLGRTNGWSPHNANAAGSTRAVYDPVSHKSTLYTFDNSGGVSWIEGRGDKLMRDTRQKDLNSGQMGQWHGRRKGVVEFVDRTHHHAVNQNKQYLDSCAHNDHAYHTPMGEMTKWMDNAFASKMIVPFYGKRPHEMGK
eukprot:CAMPEP_0115864712 /NCGR_PEP_ID=MMETSP0287-20121206/19340_1 /TAXON_ID=412157 /ORGANISM="Chrysochromulina rotalis, Strain UIO044" /LENGTH=227 /DNA_ID=CAMNT_0003319187 /DNA_START=11 /DNA_END=694 /DNA_ORIENTATION=+